MAQQGGAASQTGLVRRIFSLWVLGKVLALAILAGGGWLVYQGATSPAFRLSQTTVRGNDLVSADEIVTALPAAGTNIFTVRSSRVERALEAIPAIERSDVSLVLPSTVRVTVHERKPRAVWEAGGRQALIDADGLVLVDIADLKPGSPLQSAPSTLPSVRAPDGPFVGLGDRIDPGVVLLAESIVPHLEIAGVAGGQVEYHPSTGVTLVAPGAPRVILGFGDNIDAKLTAYRAIRSHLEQTHTTAQLIDVRFLERPYYR